MIGIDIQSFSFRLDSGETTGNSAADLIGFDAAIITLAVGKGDAPLKAALMAQPPAVTPAMNADVTAVFLDVKNLPAE